MKTAQSKTLRKTTQIFALLAALTVPACGSSSTSGNIGQPPVVGPAPGQPQTPTPPTAPVGPQLSSLVSSEDPVKIEWNFPSGLEGIFEFEACFAKPEECLAYVEFDCSTREIPPFGSLFACQRTRSSDGTLTAFQFSVVTRGGDSHFSYKNSAFKGFGEDFISVRGRVNQGPWVQGLHR